MSFRLLCSAVLTSGLLALTVEAQQVQVQVQGTGTQIRGRVLRAGDGQFVVQGPNNKEVTFYTNQQTKYYSGSQAAQYNAIRVGSTVNAWYGPPQENRTYVNTVAVLPAEGAAEPAAEPAPAQANVYEGQIVRVVGQDQVVIRTADGKEIVVYVNPQTTYRLEDRQAAYTDLRPGVPIRVDYQLRDNRPYARGIISIRRNK